MTRLSQLFPILLLAVLTSLSVWLDYTVQQGSHPAETVRHDPDYIIENIVARRLDVNGNVKQTLHAERMTHYPDDDTTHLIMPRFVSSPSGRPPVTITSKTARVSSGGENIYFETDVRALRAAYDNRSDLLLQTTLLHVIPDENIARTDQHVTITSAHTVATAIGLELNGETRTAKFHSQFKGTYHDPNHASARR